jgi:hypothetical protein
VNARVWLVLAIVALVFWIVLEGKRQERVHGKSRRRGLVRTGILELQKQLEPERKIEILLDEREDDERPASGDPERPGGPPPKAAG